MSRRRPWSKRRFRVPSRRPRSELQLSINYGRGHVPRVPGGPSQLFSTRTETYERTTKNRLPWVLGSFVAVLMGVGYALARSYYEDPWEIFYVVFAGGRGLVFVLGSVGVLASLLYYYTLGIDWPLEAACRLVAIGATLCLVVFAAVLVGVHIEGRMDEIAPSAWAIGGGLAVVSLLSWTAARRLSIE